MSLFEKLHRKTDSSYNSHSSYSQDFIPIVCHYDENTLLTKNGELIQIIQIEGIESREDDHLPNIRETIRTAIRSSLDSGNFAFWIHTIRKKLPLSKVQDEYHSLISANIHDVWTKKNLWQNRFINSLYISIIHDSSKLKIKNFNSALNSLTTNIIIDFEKKFLQSTAVTINKLTDKILASLNQYRVKKLGIFYKDQYGYSEMVYLYKNIIQFNETPCLVSNVDLSLLLGKYNYAVGNNRIEINNAGITSAGITSFATVLAIKEYDEKIANALDSFLQIPIPLVTTEVFYFVEKQKVISHYEGQDYILTVSGDLETKQIKRLDKIVQEEPTYKFCFNQISCTIIASSVDELEERVRIASKALSKIGIAHIREDINLEKTFWGQLPGNFTFLTRMSPNILDNIIALVSIDGEPIGNKQGPWGEAVTLLPTEKSIPYFMNFHDWNNNGNNYIFGCTRSRRTTLLNFLLSEADKYNPAVLYFTTDNSAELFIRAKNGIWIDEIQGLINPLLYEQSKTSEQFIFEFFKILTRHYFDPLPETTLELLKELSNSVFSMPVENRTIPDILLNYLNSKRDNKSSEADILQDRLKEYGHGGIYKEIFILKEQSLTNPALAPILAIDQGITIAFNLSGLENKPDNIINDPELNSAVKPVDQGVVQSLDQPAEQVQSPPREKEQDLDKNNTSVSLDEYDRTKIEEALPKVDEAQQKHHQQIIQTIKAAFIFAMQFALQHKLDKSRSYEDKTPLPDSENKSAAGLLAIDNLDKLLDLQYFVPLVKNIAADIAKIKGVFISTVDINALTSIDFERSLMDTIGTSFFLPTNLDTNLDLKKILNLTESEIEKLTSLISYPIASKFLIKQNSKRQNNKATAVELNFENLSGLTNILSASNVELSLYQKLIKEHGEQVENWLLPFYEELEVNS